MMHKRTLALMFCFAWIGFFTAEAQDNLTYQKPPKAIADLVEAPSTPRISIDGKGQYMLLLEVSDLPTVAELAEPELRIAGLRINPRTNGASRANHYLGITIRKISGGAEVAVKNMPANARISNVSWSPDNTKVAFTNTTDTGIDLWLIDVASAQATKLIGNVNDAYPGTPFDWVSDSKTLICRIVPDNRGAMPEENKVPQGPVVQENLGKKAPSRTYQDLLKNPYDEALFEYYTTAQLVKVSTEGKAEKIGNPGIIQSASSSPDGKLILVKSLHRPYSYLVPSYRFPTKVDVLDINGQLIKTLADLPLAENVPTGFNAVPAGPRNHAWRADAPATVYWVEAQDGGDPKKEVEVRDKVYLLGAPFNTQPTELAATKLRYSGISWGNDQLALLTESWWSNRHLITSIINPSAPGAQPVVLTDRSYEDAYNDPGNPVMKRNHYGNYVLALVGKNSVYMLGKGASPEGDRPFVDLLNLETKKSQRLWRSAAPYYEQPIAVLDMDKKIILTSRESKTENPNYFIRNLRTKKLTQVTRFPHPYPQLKQVSKQVLRYKRADGVDLTADLYLPAGYKKEQGPLPTFLWAYPEEFKSKANAGQVSGSPYQFVRVYATSPIMFVTQGYAILDNTSIPIVGEGNAEPNDTFIEQLIAGAKAAIDEGARLGVVDPNRVAVGGHSYGAFMTANLLAHSNLFRAGIARSGAYNRTFTPFGFQREERTYWEVPELYNKMSPFMHANKIKTPILLIHGEADNNPGTFPIQSERLYNALKGHGAVARFVLLPHESHGYRGKESVMHTLWETHQWLEKYVKNAPAAVSQ